MRYVLAYGCLYINGCSRKFKVVGFFKFSVRFLVINYSDFVDLRHSGYLNSPDVSGIRPCSCMC